MTVAERVLKLGEGGEDGREDEGRSFEFSSALTLTSTYKYMRVSVCLDTLHDSNQSTHGLPKGIPDMMQPQC